MWGYRCKAVFILKMLMIVCTIKNALHNQTIMKKEEEQTYQCICKLVPKIDEDKVRIY
jgi:uncharacterized membrane protein